MEGFQSAEAISGRAIGVLFFAAFGCLWLCTGLAAMHRLNVVTGAGVVLVLVLLIVPTMRLLRRAPTAVQAGDGEEARIKRAFSRVNGIQWIAIFGAVVVLNIFQKGYLIVPAIATVVGVHLFPLGRLFRYPAHYVTGTLLVVWSAGVVARLDPDEIASAGAIGTAVILLLSAIYTLIGATRAAAAMLES
jgi:hypothetical protein